MTAKETILITGAAGFLGTNLALRLLREGHDVIGIDNFYTGTQRNLTALQNFASFKLINHDVRQAFPQMAVTRIYNLACPASPMHYQRDPIATTMISVLGMKHALELATALNVPILQASTSEIYGDPEQHPQNETYRGAVNPLGIRACYDEGKRVAETLCMDFHREHGTHVKIMRIFNTYGPYMDPNDGRVVSNFICQALRGENVTIYGDGTQTRSFCFVDDLIDGMIKLMHTNDAVTGPVNIGNPDEFTILQLVEALENIIGHTLPKQYKTLPGDDPRQRRPDITLAKTLLAWSPKIRLHQGLLLTVPWFKQILETEGVIDAGPSAF